MKINITQETHLFYTYREIYKFDIGSKNYVFPVMFYKINQLPLKIKDEI